jgi:tRNA A37 threonylcarbamoyladenosine biosynthesis protein TsaE
MNSGVKGMSKTKVIAVIALLFGATMAAEKGSVMTFNATLGPRKTTMTKTIEKHMKKFEFLN